MEGVLFHRLKLLKITVIKIILYMERGIEGYYKNYGTVPGTGRGLI
mgnify:CR=1 FL=1